MLVITVVLIICGLSVILLCDEVELNPGPKENTAKKCSMCHWNFNTTAAHYFEKLVLLKAYNLVHRFDIIYLSETYLDSNILP